MWTLVTFAYGDVHTTTRTYLCTIAKKAGMQTIDFTLDDLKALSEYKAHAEWFRTAGCVQQCERCKKSNGWFAWKPLLILEALKGVPDGSWVMYMDSADVAVFPVVTDVIEKRATWCAFFRAPNGRNRNVQFGRHSCFDAMKCRAHENFVQVEAGICAFRNCRESILFLDEWFQWCVDPRANGDHPSGGEPHDFVASRHDQTILTNLIARENLPIITDQWNYIQCNVEWYRRKDLHNRPVDSLLRHHPSLGKRL